MLVFNTRMENTCFFQHNSHKYHYSTIARCGDRSQLNEKKRKEKKRIKESTPTKQQQIKTEQKNRKTEKSELTEDKFLFDH